MAWWILGVKTMDGEHEIKVGNDEARALKALDAAKQEIGMKGVVTIADRLALRGDRILAVWIEERDA